MKASDLMVGDWVLDTYTNKPMMIEDINGGNPRFGQDLEPIPLTPEILKKNGFKEYGKDDTDGAILYVLGDDFFGVSVWVNIEPCLLGIWRIWAGKSQSYSRIDELPISFVHELQHALRLCGIDKEIEL